MPDDVTPPADPGTEPSPEPEGQGSPPKTYSKRELDAIVAKAVTAARKDFSNYAELQGKAAELDRLQEASKSNEEKLRERADRAVRERDAALSRAQSTMVRSAIVAEASRLGAVDPEAVAALLPRDDLVIENDEVIGVEEAVKALLIKKPYLAQRGAQRAGAEIQGGGQQAIAVTRSQIRQWMRDGALTPERQKLVDQAVAERRVLDR
jgi:hypothetical protein